MICKSCGATIPSQLLRQDSFNCPNCGRAYRRSAQSSQNTAGGRSENPAPARRTVSSSQSSGALPGWLVPTIAGVACLALVLCIVLLVSGGSKGAYSVCGAFEPDRINAGKSVTKTIEIPRQANVQYIVATESDTAGITTSVKNKTETSFDLVIRNDNGKSRKPVMNWVLVPCKIPVLKTESNAEAQSE